jgi:transposase InsO family protein
VHARAKLTVLGRRLLVERIVAEGWPVARAAEAQGVSVATAYKWLGRWRTAGEAGLADRSCRPHRSPRRLSPERERAIVEYRRAARVGPHRIGWALGEAPSTVHAVLRPPPAAQAVGAGPPDRAGGALPTPAAGGAGPCRYQALGRIPDGGGHRLLGRGQGGANCDRRHGLGSDYLQVAVDDRTRLAYVEACDRQDGAAAAGFTGRALAWFAQLGVPVERVLTDNGWCDRSQAFQQVLAQVGAGHRRTRPYRPQTNGKAERFNLTLATEWSYARLDTSNQARLAALPGWLHHYNHHRPHAALGGRSPMQILNNLPENHS